MTIRMTKHMKIQPSTHERLTVYKAINKLSNFDKCVTKLLDEKSVN